jgi:hypothetical protein
MATILFHRRAPRFAQGADAAAVRQRLVQLSIDPRGLNAGSLTHTHAGLCFGME